MYWGTAENSLAAGTEPSAVDEGEESLNYAYALVDLFTPLSSGMNINTASADVLQLIPSPGDPAVGIRHRRHARGLDGLEGTEDDEPFENVQQLQQVPGFTREVAANAARFMSVRSSTFEVRVTAEVRKQQRTRLPCCSARSQGYKISIPIGNEGALRFHYRHQYWRRENHSHGAVAASPPRQWGGRIGDETRVHRTPG